MTIRFGDVHVVISHKEETAHAYRKTIADPVDLFKISVLTKGVGGGQDDRGGDTPFGDYRMEDPIFTTVADDYGTHLAYGPIFFPLGDLEGQESRRGRSGIGLHGGGTILGAASQADNQTLVPTEGCIRAHNGDLMHRVLPIYQRARQEGRQVILTVQA